MDFRWKSQADNSQESPASSGSETEPFYSYSAAAAARSSEDLAVYNALFGPNEAGSSSSVLGLTSMDFWNMEDVKPMTGSNSSRNPATYNSAAYDSSQQNAFAPAQPAGASTYKDTYNALGNAVTPDAVMTFDDMPTGTTYNTVQSTANLISQISPPSQNAFGQLSSMEASLPTSALFGGIASNPSSVYGSPVSGTEGVALQDILNTSNFDAYGMPSSGYNIASPSPPISPNSILRNLSSSASDQATSASSSRASSQDPAYRYPQDQTAQNVASKNSNRKDNSYDKTPSTTSSTRTHTATNSPPSKNAGLRMSKSSVSVKSEYIEPSAYSQQAPIASTSGSAQMTDKATQQQASESSQHVKSISRSAPAGGNSQIQLLILGLPEEGARSRVETQVRIGLTLLKPKSNQPTVKLEDSLSASSSSQPRALLYRDAKGSLLPEADQYFERVGTWKYMALPAVSSVKRRAKKHFRTNIPPEQTLFADIKVVSATNPSNEVYVCQNCQQREYKRLQRKTQNRSKPAQDIDSGKEDEEGMTEMELARQKIVLFNCGQYLDFHNGEVVIPTRITCYCRHHKEKYGFNIAYTLSDHLGNHIVSAMSPAIFLTDDHKARPTKPDTVDLKHFTSLAAVANGPSYTTSRSSSAWNSAASSMPSSAASSQASSQASSAANSNRPSRSNSVENLESLGAAESQVSKSRREQRSGKPYNLENRPTKAKRNSSMNRLNSFTMTPLTRSQPGSPRLGPISPLAAQQHLPSESLYKASEPLMDYLSNTGFTAATETHPSPGSSQSAPSTPGASLDSYGSSWPNAGQPWQMPSTAPGSVTSGDEQFPPGLRSVEPSPAFAGFTSLPTQTPPGNLNQTLAALEVSEPPNQRPQPVISRLVPAEGPTHGGVEVIILGDNFYQGLEVTFGETVATGTQIWGTNTVVCLLPPSPTPGPVIVSFKGTNLSMVGAGVQLFTYLDTSDKALMELALQVVGMKMTGRIDDARNVARRIIGTEDSNLSQASSTSPNLPTGPFMQAAGNTSKGNDLQQHIASLSSAKNVRDFQAIILNLLSLLDVDYSDSEGHSGLQANPLDHKNAQQHTLLHLAAILGFHRLVDFLIQRGAELNSIDKCGNSPLHLAALMGRLTAARLLLEAGASLALRNKAGDTALDVARHQDQPDIAVIMSRHVRSRAPSISDKTPEPVLAGSSQRTPKRRQVFNFEEQDDSDSDSYDGQASHSDWSSDEDDSPFSSGSNLKSRLSRHVSAVSMSALNTSQPSTPASSWEADSAHEDAEKEGASAQRGLAVSQTLSLLSLDKGCLRSPRWLSKLWQERITTKIKLPHPPPLGSWLQTHVSTTDDGQAQGTGVSSTSPVVENEHAPTQTESPSSISPSKSNPKLAPKAVKAGLIRRLGYSIDHLTEDALRSYTYRTQKYNNLSRDKMLYFFWLPLLFLAIIWTSYQASNVVRSSLSSLHRLVFSS